MGSVNQTHPSYDEMLPEWQLVKACASGEREVKKLKTDVLPAPAETNGVYDVDRYKQYLTRAIYTNVTGRTKQGLVGAAFRVAGEVELPAGLEYLEQNADGAGQSLTQMAKDVFSENLETGRECLLVDYPEVEDGLTLEQMEIINPQATIKRYGALDLINWKTEIILGREVLTLAVLRESYNDSDDEFAHQMKHQYRVLRLDSVLDGENQSSSSVYSQQIYRDNDPIESPRFPKMANGARFDFIPLFIIGSQSNDSGVDAVPLSDIAYVNVGHFRNSADLEENSFVHGQLTLGVTSDMDSDLWKEMNPNGIVVGSQAGHFLGSTGGFHTAQADSNQIADKLQERKEAQMLSLGAKLVEQRNPNETAAAAKIDATGENSVLSDLVTNVEEGMQRAIEWCGLFMGEESNFVFKMNRQFFDDSIDPQMVMAAIQGYDRSIIAKSDLQNTYRKSGIIEEGRTNEDIDNETGQANPLE